MLDVRKVSNIDLANSDIGERGRSELHRIAGGTNRAMKI